RLLDVNPCMDIEGPDIDDEERTKSWLFPVEAEQLFACTEIPLGRRRMYAVAIYLALRASELAGLCGGDRERAAARVHVHRQRERRTGDLVPTKTALPRY